eukprot:8753855-Pyramimonas_sp.AAC.1
MEKTRRFLKQLKYRENDMRLLIKIMEKHYVSVVQLSIDSSSKWDGTPKMLESVLKAKDAIQQFFRDHEDVVPETSRLLESDFALLREVEG